MYVAEVFIDIADNKVDVSDTDALESMTSCIIETRYLIERPCCSSVSLEPAA